MNSVLPHLRPHLLHASVCYQFVWWLDAWHCISTSCCYFMLFNPGVLSDGVANHTAASAAASSNHPYYHKYLRHILCSMLFVARQPSIEPNAGIISLRSSLQSNRDVLGIIVVAILTTVSSVCLYRRRHLSLHQDSSPGPHQRKRHSSSVASS